MKNIYDGVTTLDQNGEAVIILPEWFGALNSDFRYHKLPHEQGLYYHPELYGHPREMGLHRPTPIEAHTV